MNQELPTAQGEQMSGSPHVSHGVQSAEVDGEGDKGIGQESHGGGGQDLYSRPRPTTCTRGPHGLPHQSEQDRNKVYRGETREERDQATSLFGRNQVAEQQGQLLPVEIGGQNDWR